MYKKFLSLVLVVVIAFSIIACGEKHECFNCYKTKKCESYTYWDDNTTYERWMCSKKCADEHGKACGFKGWGNTIKAMD